MSVFAGFWVDGSVRQPEQRHCDLAHENEAPFPESLVEPFIKCYCPPGGVVLDPFCGSGTTLSVAKRLDRNSIGMDIRESQVLLTLRRAGE